MTESTPGQIKRSNTQVTGLMTSSKALGSLHTLTVVDMRVHFIIICAMGKDYSRLREIKAAMRGTGNGTRSMVRVSLLGKTGQSSVVSG